MKRIMKMLLCMVLAIGLVYTPVYMPVLEESPTVAVAEAATVKISKKSATVNVGATLKLKMNGTKKKVTWSTSKKSVATVTKKGVVTGKKAGKVTITAKIGKKKYTCKVTVKEAPKLNKKIASIKVGGKVTLKVTGTAKKVTWSTSKKSVATVTSKGVVTGKKAGTATITAKVGTKKLTCKVTVKAKAVKPATPAPSVPNEPVTPAPSVPNEPVTPAPSVPNEPVTPAPSVPSEPTTPSPSVPAPPANVAVNSVTLDKTSVNVNVQEGVALTATVNPSDATDKTIIWTSDNPAIATVDANGYVTAVAKGNTKIYATAGGKKATCYVYVKIPSVESVTLDQTSVTLDAGGTATLTATINPFNADDQTVDWKSGNNKIATVDANGVVTAVAPGTTKITATAGYKSATCTVTVNTPKFKMGEVWEVPGQWRFKVNSVTTHYKCNQFEKDPGVQVITINYTYWCDGETAFSGGLNFDFTDFAVYDKNGESANHYTCTHNTSSKYISSGKMCTAAASFILPSESDFITVDVDENAKGYVEYKATFELDFGEKTPEVDNPSDDEGEADEEEGGNTVVSNLTNLKNYITSYGSLNTSGNKFIKKELTSSSGKSAGGIVYQSASDDFNFICTNEMNSGAKTTISMVLNRTATGTVKPEIILSYQSAGMGFQSHANFAPSSYDGEDVYFTVDSYVGMTSSNVQTLSNSALQLAFTAWEATLFEKTGLTLSDIGFTAFSVSDGGGSNSGTGTVTSPAAQNLTSLKNYITSYGSLNTSGNRFIKKELTSSSGKSAGGIVYQSASDDFNFICTNEMNSGAKTTISMVLNRTATGTVKPEIIMSYQSAGMGFQSHANFAPSTYDGEEEVYFTVDSYVGMTSSSVQTLSNSALQLAFTAWEATLYEKTGLTLSDIGFTDFSI